MKIQYVQVTKITMIMVMRRRITMCFVHCPMCSHQKCAPTIALTNGSQIFINLMPWKMVILRMMTMAMTSSLCFVQCSHQKWLTTINGSQIGDTWCTPFICGSRINVMMMTITIIMIKLHLTLTFMFDLEHAFYLCLTH